MLLQPCLPLQAVANEDEGKDGERLAWMELDTQQGSFVSFPGV